MDVIDDCPVLPLFICILSSMVFLDLLPALDGQGSLCLCWQCPNLAEYYYYIYIRQLAL